MAAQELQTMANLMAFIAGNTDNFDRQGKALYLEGTT